MWSLMCMQKAIVLPHSEATTNISAVKGRGSCADPSLCLAHKITLGSFSLAFL